MMSSDAQTMWDAWFDDQHALSECITRAVREQSKGKGDGFAVALYAALIEHCAEEMRIHIPEVALPAKAPS